MGHLTLSITEAILSLTLKVLVMLAPVFALVFWRGSFGGSARGYLKAYLATASRLIALFTLLAFLEEAAQA
jgi:hypothetical protein